MGPDVKERATLAGLLLESLEEETEPGVEELRHHQGPFSGFVPIDEY